ncbi:uncharacterized protein LOC117120830 [Anneissia japonica]|uniref:uncharacterized protein LOC117120830 n=1 Tax=Anneissia japonica TaxID=1529436 RepID=UPI001425905C|nr:uncharacterized protein LOC117120830 [Anneissia japonica]
MTEAAALALVFDSFDIRSGDYLQIKDGDTVLRLSGSTLPKNFISTGKEVEVTFHSEGFANTSGTGFRMHVEDRTEGIPDPKENIVKEDLKSASILRLTSSNYPNRYPVVQKQVFEISTSSGLPMVIDVLDVDLENKYDFITFNDSGDLQITLTGNQMVMAPYLSGPSVTITFTSDYSGSGRGFAVTLQEFVGDVEEKELPSDPPAMTIRNYTHSVPSDGVKITSPDYPNSYPDNLLYIWLFTGIPGQRLRLDFFYLELENTYDVLVIGTGNDPMDMSSRYAIFTGSNLPDGIVLDSESAWIQFRTDASISGKGFSLTVNTASDCIYEYSLAEGEKRDVSYASIDAGYCQWVIRAERGKHIQLSFSQLQLENLYETLEFGTGSNPASAASRLRVLTGTTGLATYTTPSDGIWLAATIRESVSGFKVQVSDDGCMIESIFEDQGVITSPGYPLTYPNDADCIWIIQTAGEYNIRLRFNDFTTEGFYDRLIIGGVNDGSDRDYLELSGSSLPDNVDSNLNGLSLRFKSDGTSVTKGFNISYSKVYGCPDGYLPGYDGETCYKFVTEIKTWEEARKDCLQTPYSDLIVIKDEAEARYIQNSMNEADQVWWVGLSDQQKERAWAWVNCDYVQEGNISWAVNEPTNTTSENCVTFNMDGRYSDRNCSKGFPYICKEEYKGFDSDEQQPGSFTAVSEIPYQIDLSWELSAFDCDVSAYQLVVGFSNGSIIHDKTYGPFETSAKLEDLTPDTEYRCELITVTYGEGELEGSLTLSTRTVAELVCPVGYQLNKLNNKCYQVVDSVNMTWVEARQSCVATPNADLVIIDSEEMDDIVDDLLQSNNGGFWFGLYDWHGINMWAQVNTCRPPTYDQFIMNDTYTEPHCAVKLKDIGWDAQPCNNTYGYICEYFPRDLNKTSANPNFVRADLLEPTTVQMYWTPSIRLCDVVGYVVTWTKVGNMPTIEYVEGALANAKVFYNLDQLTEYEFSVAAQTVTFGALEPDVVNTVLTGVVCPLGYEVGFNNNCYMFGKAIVTWEQARTTCADDGGYLVIINDANELEYVMNTTLGGDWWIGFNDQVSEGSWYWADCSSSNAWQKSNWAPGQPNNLNNMENCAKIRDDGQWNDWTCALTLPYICEIPKEGVDKLEQNPSGLTGATVTYNRVNLQWVPATKRCDIVGYMVTYTGSGVGQYSVVGGDQTESDIAGLEPNSTYTFRINAVAFYGDLPIVEGESVNLTTTVKQEGSCPYEYEKVNGVCYKFVKELATWADAQKSCMEDGAVIVIIRDPIEKNMLMNRTGGGDCWIGLNDQVEEGSFYWGDCSTISTWQGQQWGDDQPNDVDGNQDCVMMMPSGAWNDWMCQETNQYICEVVDIGYEINPSEFAGVVSSPFSVTLTWKPSSRNCDVVEYRIRYVDRSIQTVVIPGKNSDMADIEGLRSGTEYSFQIGALTAVGNIEYSDPLVLTTRNFTSGDCSDGTLTDTAGNITSPNFPVEYPPNADCAYIITLPDNNMRVRLRFESFDLVDHDDYIEITDLNTGEDDRNMLTLTGVERPKDYVSMTNSVKIHFVSGPLSQGAVGSGFLIGYEEEHEALPVDKNCREMYTLKEGSLMRIQSTNYPNSYSNYENCTWTLKASVTTNVIVVNFFDVDLESNYDYLSFNDAQQTIITGDIVPASVISESDTLTFMMRTDLSVIGRGFSLAAEEIDPSLTVPKDKLMSEVPVIQATCGDTVDVSGGAQTIVSPSYPNNYENNANCLWKIAGSENNGILIDFQSFVLEYMYDYVLIGRGSDESDATSIIGKFSGPDKPSQMVVDSSTAWIQFISDSDITGAGFQIVVSMKTKCGEDLVIPNGGSVQVISANSPGLYNNNEYCLYKISSQRGTYVRFDLMKLDVEEGYDFLLFGSGPNPTDFSSQLFSFTGSIAAESSYHASSNELWVIFTSDATNSGDGYIINAYDDGCGISSLFGSSGQIVSPSYPSMYPNSADCIWIIQVAGTFQVEVTFMEFNLETGRDFLIFGGITQDPLEDQEIILTGNVLPEKILSIANGLNLKFISDSSSSSSGFYLTWKAKHFCPDGYAAARDNETVCYKFGSEPKPWLDAREDCLSTPGADLVIVNDKTENDYLAGVGGGDDWWIGFYDRSVEGEWFWVDCLASTEWAVSNWAPGQPDGNAVTSANCAKLVGSSGMYDDTDCMTPVKYVCEHYERLYDPADAVPTRLEADSIAPTRITLSWRIPLRYCDVLGYTVRYNGTNGYIEKSFPGSQTNTVVIENLLPDTLYVFEITSYTNSFGVLPYEESTTVKTLKPEDELCPDGWVVGLSYTCYKFSTTPRTWADARSDCMTIEGGDLLVIADAEEHSYIRNMTDMQNTWWIGFYDQADEDSWRWVDCSIPSVWQRSQWASGQPDDSNGLSDCGQMNAAGQWQDEECSRMNNYICERLEKPFTPEDANPSLFRGQVLNPVSVSFTWRPSRYNCDVTGYKIKYQDGALPKEVQVSGAETSEAVIRDLTPATTYVFSIAATTLFGDLSDSQSLTLKTLNESDFLCPEGYEIGYDYNCFKFSLEPRTWNEARKDCQSSLNADLAILDTPEDVNYVLQVSDTPLNYWIGYYDVGVENTWQWIDCTDPSTFTMGNWGPGEPSDDIIGNEDCGQLQSNGYFYDVDCAQPMFYICKVVHKNFEPADFNPRLFSAVSFSPFNALLTWQTSDILCDITGYRIRYNSTDKDVKVKTVPGALSNSVRINDLLPSTTYSFTIAAVLTTGSLPYGANAQTTTDSVNDFCPAGWEIGHNYYCYKYGKTPMTWQKARADCQGTPGGDLAIVDSQNELEYIMNTTKGGNWWIGLYDQATEGDWSWIDCSRLGVWGMLNWGTDQPNDLDGTQDCGQILNNGRFNDIACDVYMEYICEIVDIAFNDSDLVPSRFSGEALSPNDIQLSWRPARRNCEVSGYKVFIEVGGVETFVNVTGGNTDSLILKNMESRTAYRFSIGTYTISGREIGRSTDTAFIITPAVGVCGDSYRNEASGRITSPDYPKDYPDNQDCLYIVNIPDSSAAIQVEFYTFDLEDGQDFLLIGSGNEADNNVQYMFTGSKLPVPVTISSSRLWIRFFSDEDKTSSGFDLTYSTVGVPTTTKKPAEPTTLADPIEVGGTMMTLLGESEKSFDEQKQLKLAESLADQANEYCAVSFTACLAPRNSLYKSDNIVYYSFEEVNANLEVKFWVNDPSNTEVAAMTTEQVQDMLNNNIDESEFEYIVGPVEPVESSSLEPWVITLISFFALVMLIIILVAVKECHSPSKKSSFIDKKSENHEMDIAEDGNANISNATPQRRPSEHTNNIYFETNTGATNSGFKPDTVPDTSIAGASKHDTQGDDLPAELPKDKITDASAL